ncbi:hypothetical protein G6F55_003504 [Rhizopus delemar]|uniref:dual-specificity kinase n=2 Tax=Rhizopus TaxID=4842 RepID=A0A9P6Z9K0_9FUNG|nr:hypothetical protein G6F55_003504 [Rhizopus delemar]KAG1546189.1 hypothetical protein G6F51_005023 [Rhizopus arrhizus]KAG1516861.1 hypothetical protein G6F53_001831 [Rhizopus delemar]KAG1522345.1 hypothetical protein G6F52_005942 [Rhizopus delemar]KAG1573608.1 hypothetical protein G6F50_002697 [Rhizopus delemar]
MIPTRLPAPPHRQNATEQPSTVAQLTPPSSPAGGSSRRVRQTSIARLSKLQTNKESSGKANQELAEFDPLISPIKSDSHKPDPLASFTNLSIKTGNELDESMKQEKKLANNNNTRLPIPIQNKSSAVLCKGKSKSSNDNSENECEIHNKQKEDSMTHTKLRRPEIFTSKSVKSLSSHFNQEITLDQIAKERLIKPSASYVSAHGVISQPDEEAILKHSSEPNLALHRFKPFLSPYEQTEILRYHSVYCVGSHAKKHWATMDQSSLNYGYDDENGDYKIVIRDHLNYRYEIIESLGKGSFGQVVKCRDMKPQSKEADSSNNIVAVKIIRNKKKYHAQALTEIKILEKLMQLVMTNVGNLKARSLFRFAHQILTALNLLSEHNIIHCDLKPENILLKQPDKSGIRVIDLGSSCFVNEKVYSYIQSRFYRAPEVILGLEYGLPIDMWSTGCILAELYTGRPLFPGENELDQLACIMQLLGVPSKQYLDKCTRKKQFFGN